VGVLMGGLSSEREVSLRSGAKCHEALLSLGYDAVPLDVGRDVAFRLREEGIEVAFLALHGRYGEDGSIQGVLEYLGIPYTGSGVLASALGMNKTACKKIVAQNGVPTPDYVELDHTTDAEELTTLCVERLGLPAILKPVNEGSSVGVVKCKSQSQLSSAVTEARQRYGNVFVERFVDGKEITVSLIENGGVVTGLPVLELIPKNEFYDYEAKYTKGMTQFVLPANLPAAVAREAQALSETVFRAVGCRGYARVDLMVGRDGTPYFIEVNTLPGMTELSDLPAQAKVAGISYEELVEIILHSAHLEG